MSRCRTISYLLLVVCPIATSAPASAQPNMQQNIAVTVYFNSDQYTLTPEADSILDRYVRNAKISPGSHRLEIAGFCDNSGSDNHNNRLSLNRAGAVKAYLLQHRLDTGAIPYITAHGSRDPLNDNRTPSDRAINRRVTIRLTPSPAPDTPSIAVHPSIYKQLTDTFNRTGTSITLNDVVFIGGRHQPLGFSYTALNDLLKAMRENFSLRIRIEGHVCCIPETLDGPDLDTGESDLSVQRAKFVYTYLVSNGIAKDRMSYVGLGGANKLYPQETSPVQQAQNRRVGIRIIAK
jgi:outer membrane protein OmpA-like peptidoglycan-associated protein